MRNKQWIYPFMMCFVPILIGIMVYSKMPELMPIHFNSQGVADNYASKEFALFGLPLIMAALFLVCVFGMKSDPKNKNHSDKLLTLSLWIIPVLSTLMSVMVICICLGMDVNIEIFVPVLVGIVMIIIGNYLPKVKQNYTMGIKIPWTLDSEENWRKTHRFGGFAFVIAGLWMILSVVLGIKGWAAIVPVILAAFVPMVYSYLLYMKKENNE
ncbi:MAG: SdpI family protein [Erysipelotrichaceae bacterium]|nr:SdpI family protein [Erysipelotrichaceae bacterium]